MGSNLGDFGLVMGEEGESGCCEFWWAVEEEVRGRISMFE